MGFAGFLDHTLLHSYHYRTLTTLEVIHKSKELAGGSSTFFQLLCANAKCSKNWLSLLAEGLTHYIYFRQHNWENSLQFLCQGSFEQSRHTSVFLLAPGFPSIQVPYRLSEWGGGAKSLGHTSMCQKKNPTGTGLETALRWHNLYSQRIQSASGQLLLVFSFCFSMSLCCSLRQW